MFGKKNNYLEAAKSNEKIFRLILDKFKVNHSELSVEEIYDKYSEGDRYGKWTILDFKETEPDLFYFAVENIAFLSGSGRADIWTLVDGELRHIKNQGQWMS